jgi:hypothetical protein
VAHPMSAARKRNPIPVTSQPRDLKNQATGALLVSDSANVIGMSVMFLMRQLEINSFVSFTLAVVLLFIGKVALNRSKTLRKYIDNFFANL